MPLVKGIPGWLKTSGLHSPFSPWQCVNSVVCDVVQVLVVPAE